MTKNCSVVIIALLLCCGRATAQVKVEGVVFDSQGKLLNAVVYLEFPPPRGGTIQIWSQGGKFAGNLPKVGVESFTLACQFGGAYTRVHHLSTRRSHVINVYHDPQLRAQSTPTLLEEARTYRILSARLHTIKDAEARVSLTKLFKEKLPGKRMAALQDELQRRSDRGDPLLKGGGWRADFKAFEERLNSKPFKEMMERR